MSRLDPKKPFYLPQSIGNLDGTLDPASSPEEGYKSLNEAAAYAAEQQAEHGGLWVVFKCSPVKRIGRWNARGSAWPTKEEERQARRAAAERKAELLTIGVDGR